MTLIASELPTIQTESSPENMLTGATKQALTDVLIYATFNFPKI